jgi:hypothetical protein
MGTRNLTKVVMNGDVVVAQYGQWDGYPAGQGITAFNFLKEKENRWALEMGLQRVYYPTQDELNEMVKPFEDGSLPGGMTMDSGKAFAEKYPSLTRDTCAEILEVIAKSKEAVPISLDIDFESDALFCEAVYEVDLDYGLFVSYWDRDSSTGEWGSKVVLSFDSLALMDNDQYLKMFQNEDDLVTN